MVASPDWVRLDEEYRAVVEFFQLPNELFLPSTAGIVPPEVTGRSCPVSCFTPCRKALGAAGIAQLREKLIEASPKPRAKTANSDDSHHAESTKQPSMTTNGEPDDSEDPKPKSFADIVKSRAKAAEKAPTPPSQTSSRGGNAQGFTVVKGGKAEEKKKGVPSKVVHETDPATMKALMKIASIELSAPHLLQVNDRNFEMPNKAKFYVIKSYSEDDIHKSIKYGVWASTEGGNRRLAEAWKEVEAEPNKKSLIYLLFSVNASGQFCGCAQMTSNVDYKAKLDCWAGDKWSGKFTLKWAFIKDIPNSMFRHIILENNEFKPVTNSRDTQEVPPEHGNEILKIFRNYKHKTSLLDDFSFYDDRQKEMEEAKTLGKRKLLIDGINEEFVLPPRQKGKDPPTPAPKTTKDTASVSKGSK